MAFKLDNDDFQRIHECIAQHDHHATVEYLTGVKHKYKSADNEKRAAYYYNLAIAYSKIGDYTKADQCFDKAIGDYSGSFLIALERVNSYFQRGALKEAKAILDLLEEGNKTEDSSLHRLFCINMGRYYLYSGDYKRALPYFEKASPLGKQPLTPLTEKNLAEEYIARNASRIQATLQFSSHLFNIDWNSKPPTKLSITFLENLLKNCTDSDEQIKYCEKLSKFSKGFKEYGKARAYVDRALAIHPNNPELYAERIWILCQDKQPHQALELYNRDKNLIRSSPRATMAVLQSFNVASNVTDFGTLTDTFATIVSSLAKNLLKQKSAPEHFCAHARRILQC